MPISEDVLERAYQKLQQSRGAELKPQDVPGPRSTPGLMESVESAGERFMLQRVSEAQQREGRKLLQELQSGGDARISTWVTREVPSSEAERVKQLAKRLGVPEAAVRADQRRAREKVEIESIPFDEISRRHPGLNTYIQDPNNAAAAREQINVLKDVSDWVQKHDFEHGDPEASAADVLKQRFTKGGNVVRRSEIGMRFIMSRAGAQDGLTVAEEAEAEELERELQRGERALAPWEQPLAAASEQLPILGEILQRAGIGYATGATVGGIAGGVLTRTPAGAIRGAKIGGGVGGRVEAARAAFLLEAGNAAEDFRKLTDEKGNLLDPDVAAAGATMVGAVNAALEYLSLSMLGKTFDGLKPVINSKIRKALQTEQGQSAMLAFMKRYGSAVATEGGTEGLQELVLIVGETLTKAADSGSFTEASVADAFDVLTDPETWAQVGESAKHGALATVVLGAPGSAMSAHVEKKYRERISENEQARIDHINETVTSSGVQKQSPETLRQSVEAMEAEAETPTEVYLPEQDVREYFAQQGIDAKDVPGMEAIAEQLKEKAGTGQDVVLPASEFITNVIGSEHYDGLRPHMRLSAESLTQSEAKIAEVEQQAFVEQLVQQAEQQTQTLQEAQQVFETVREQLVSSGRMTRQNAKMAAQILPAWATVQATERGVSVEQVFQESGFNVQGPEAQRAEGARIDAGIPSERAQEILNQFERGEAVEVPAGVDFKAMDDTGVVRETTVDEAGEKTVRVKLIEPKPERSREDFATDEEFQRYEELRQEVEAERETGRTLVRGMFEQAETLKQSATSSQNGQSISTRLPTNMRARENPFDTRLLIGVDAMKADPAKFEHNMVNVLGQYAAIPEGVTDPDEIAQVFSEFVEGNLRWLYENTPAEIRERSKLWYEGANNIARKLGVKFDVDIEVAAAVLAALSPQMDWFKNVSLGERVLFIMAEHQDTVWDDKMSQKVKGIDSFNSKLNKQRLDEIKGKTLSEAVALGDKHAAMWLRAYDETYNDRSHRVVTPEGDFAETVTKKDGTPAGTGWGGFGEIGKAIAVIRDPSLDNISRQMGSQHKVRNFYNNIADPQSLDGAVTIDTHAVAASLLEPLAGGDVEVHHNFGSAPAKNKRPPNWVPTKQNNDTGAQGLYGLYADAYRKVAEELGILPRELQSITWEAVRGLYTETFKTAKNKDKIREIWHNYHNELITLDDARDQLLEAANGIDHPAWHDGRDTAGITRGRLPSDEGELYRGSVAGVRPGRAASRTGGLDSRTPVRPQARGIEALRGLLRGVGQADRSVPRVFSSQTADTPGGRRVTYAPGPEAAAALREEGAAVLSYTETPDAQEFLDAITAAKGSNPHSAAVEVKSLDEYASGSYRLFLSEDKTVGFAVARDGDIVSVFKSPESGHPRAVISALALAIEQGGVKLDAFDTVLPDLYSRLGFVARSRVAWVDEFAPDNWDYDLFSDFNGGRPDVVLMSLDLNSSGEYNGEGTLYESWDEAASVRDREVESRAPQPPLRQAALSNVDLISDDLQAMIDHPLLAATEERLKQIPETNRGDPARFEMQNNIALEMYGEGAAKQEKKVFLVMGPPASGKSTLVEGLEGKGGLAEQTGSVLIDSDFAKERIPEFNGGIGANSVHMESKKIAAIALEMAKARGDNIVEPLVGHNYDAMRERIDEYVSQGYTVSVRLVDLPVEKTFRRAIGRFQSTGRYIPPSYVFSKVGYGPVETYLRLQKEGLANDFAAFNSDVEKGVELPEIQDLEAHHAGRSVPAVVLPTRPESGRRESRQGAGTEADVLSQEGIARGEFDPATSTVRMLEASDLTTFLHETAHFFLEMERRNPESTRIDAINSWFMGNAGAIAGEAADIAREGKDPQELDIRPSDVEAYVVTGTTGDPAKDSAVRVATHEQFARGFEKYVSEGKAPTNELAKAFQAFARWISQVYARLLGGVEGQLNVNLTDDARAFFDRLLATEEQIEIAETKSRYEPLFTDAAVAGMTEEQYRDYQEKRAKATRKAKETLRAKMIKELTRQNEKWWQEQYAAKEVEIREQMEQERVYNARRTLTSTDGFKLDRRAVKEQLGIEKIPPILRNMTVTGGEGLSPQDAAALLGYGSQGEMFQDLMTAPSLNDAVAEKTQEAMVAEHGDVLNDGTIERLADQATQNEERGEVLLAELKALAGRTRRPAIDRGIIKQLAEEQISKLPLNNIRADRYRRAEIRAAQDAVRAVQAGDHDAALQAKTKQALNFYLGKAAVEAREWGVKFQRRMRKYSKKKTHTRLRKAGNGYFEQIVGILERFELRTGVSMATINREGLDKWAAERMQAGDNLQLTPEVMAEQVYRMHWKEVPLQILRGVDDSIANIDFIARYNTELVLEGERVDYEAIRDAWVEKINNLPKKFLPQRSKAVDPKERSKRLVRKASAEMTKTPWLASWLDGQERVGLSHRILNQPFTDAYHAEAMLWQEVGLPIMKALDSMSKEDKKWSATKFHIPELVDENNDGNLYGGQILAVALNTGNAGNLRKMLMGEGWALTEEQVRFDNPQLQAVLSHMSKERWELVQLIWDQIDQLRKPMAEVHKATSGLDLQVVKPTPLRTEFGTFRGGYYPMVYDSLRDVGAEENQEKAKEITDSMLNAQGMFQPGTAAGATHDRTKYTGPVRFDLNVVPNHVQEVIHYITHFQAVMQTHRLLRDPQVVQAMNATVGNEEVSVLRDWLNAVAKDGREGTDKLTIASVLGRLRLGVTLGLMGFKASTGLMQFLGLSNAAAEVGAGNLRTAVWDIIGGWDHMKDRWEHAAQLSKVLPHRIKTMDREINQALKRLEGKGTKRAWVQEASMKHIAMIQTYMVDLPTWYAAYNKIIKANPDMHPDKVEAKAVQYADWAVESIHGSGTVKNMAKVMRSKNEAWRMMTMFMTFFSSLWNQQRDLYRGANSGAYNSTSVAARAMFIIVVPVLAEMWIKGELEPEEDEDEVEYIARTLAKIATYPTQAVPLLRDAVNGLVTGYDYNISPLQSIIGRGLDSSASLVDAAIDDEKEATKAQVKNTTKLAGAWFGIPGVSQAWATGEQIYDMMVEGEEFTLRELAFGPKRD